MFRKTIIRKAKVKNPELAINDYLEDNKESVKKTSSATRHYLEGEGLANSLNLLSAGRNLNKDLSDMLVNDSSEKKPVRN